MQIEEKKFTFLHKNDSKKIIKHSRQMNSIEKNVNTGVIYSVTSKIDGKSYIGQAKDYKYKDGKPYSYGMKGRWSDHVSDIMPTPLHKAIKEQGAKNFILNLMLRCEIKELDGWEARIIEHNNTLVPNGYNVSKHSRVKNREESNLAYFYLEKAVSIEVKPVKEKGENKIVYVYIKEEDEDKERTRFTFGQGKNSNFEEAKKEALEFIEPFQMKNISISIHPLINGDKDPLVPYYGKIEAMKNLDVKQITISKNRSTMCDLIVLKIKHSENKVSKICFGGKTIETYEAYKIAKKFIQRIINDKTKIIETEILAKFLKSATGSCE